MSLSPSAQLLRGFAVDFLTAHNLAAVETVMEPDYSLSIGGFLLSGRDDVYLPATAAQLQQFPGLCVTVHDTVIGPDAVAMRFTEHGASNRHDGRLSTWGGVTMFRIRNGRLHQGWAEEDYYARKRQLAFATCDDILPPHPAPWDAPFELPDVAVEAAASAWLTNPANWAGSRCIDEISADGPRLADLVAIEVVTIDCLFSAGNRGAFHISCAGNYRGGFADIDTSHIDQSVTLRLSGIFDVAGGQVARVQVCADRLGLNRSLMGSK